MSDVDVSAVLERLGGMLPEKFWELSHKGEEARLFCSLACLVAWVERYKREL